MEGIKKRRINPIYTKLDIILGIKEMGYTEEEALHCYYVIEEVKKGKLKEKKAKNEKPVNKVDEDNLFWLDEENAKYEECP
jgi:hypothetical protein